MNKLTIILISILLTVSVACKHESKKATSDTQQQKQTEQALSEAQRQIGMPNIINFQQRKMMKMIFELTDREDLITYVYLKSDYTGKLIFLGKGVGFGVPFSAQFTNPMKIVDIERTGAANEKHQDSGEIQVVPQADPNGLFMPTSSSATWMLMIDPNDNTPRPVYIEPEIVVSPFSLHN